MEKEAIILGGGIAGLSLAWYLRQKGYAKKICILEKSSRLGGMIHSEEREGFFFEKGPRTFRVSRSLALLDLIQDMGIESKLLFASDAPKYIYQKGKLSSVPANPASFLTSPLTRPLLSCLHKEWRVPPYPHDESIHSFITRRLHPKLADTLFDAITLGVYAGDSKLLSVASCFPLLKKWEREYGSLTKGMFLHKKEKRTSSYAPSQLFTLEGGMVSLIQELERKIESEVALKEEIHSVSYEKKEYVIRTEKNVYETKNLFSALPSYALAKALPKTGNLSGLLASIPYKDLSCVHIGYRKKVLPLSGFGYLVPMQEKQNILGAVFDSEIFPSQNQQSETRITLMCSQADLPEELLYRQALDALLQHLQVDEVPDFFSVTRHKNALPQYLVGHEEKLGKIRESAQEEMPGLTILGNYLSCISVNDCIAHAKNTAQNFLKKF